MAKPIGHQAQNRYRTTGKFISIDPDMSGLQAALNRLNVAAEKLTPALAGAMYKEHEGVMAKSQEIVPVKDGHLKASGIVMPPTISGTHVQQVSGYGGVARLYAIKQHELDYKHTPPQQKKFLEQPAREALTGMTGRIVEKIQREIRA